MSRLLTALLVVLVGRPDALLGQAAAPAASLQPGTRVRITQPGQQPRIAAVVTGSGDTLFVRWPEFANTTAIPLAEVSRLEVSTGRHRNVLKGALVGTLSAGAVGGVLGAATYAPCTSTEAFGCLLEPAGRGESALLGGVVGGVLGLIVGTLVGLPSREGWQRMPLDTRRVSVAVTPRASSTGLGLSVRF
jgi:hypothetical protein